MSERQDVKSLALYAVVALVTNWQMAISPAPGGGDVVAALLLLVGELPHAVSAVAHVRAATAVANRTPKRRVIGKLLSG
jgi:uncharacterized membrane protein